MKLEKLKKLWSDLGDILVNEEGEIETPFLNFPIGTDKFEVWQWFEDQNESFIVAEMLYKA